MEEDHAPTPDADRTRVRCPWSATRRWNPMVRLSHAPSPYHRFL